MAGAREGTGRERGSGGVGLGLSFAPLGLALFLASYPRLAPWAVFFRRFAARNPAFSIRRSAEASRSRHPFLPPALTIPVLFPRLLAAHLGHPLSRIHGAAALAGTAVARRGVLVVI